MNRLAWMNCARATACLAGASLAAAGGCSSPPRPAAVSAHAGAVETGAADMAVHASAPMRRRIAGRSVEGRPIDVWTIGSGDLVVLIIASIHGDEAAGTPLLERLSYELRARPELVAGRTVVLLPRANPDGVVLGRRTNVNGVDLNRNFPAANYAARRRDNGTGPLSEPESQALHDLILEVRPDRVISLHQPLRCIDYDGPARELAEAMSEACSLPVRKLGARPGSLGSWVGLELGIPIVTVELPGAARSWSEDGLWEKYGRMLLAGIAH